MSSDWLMKRGHQSVNAARINASTSADRPKQRRAKSRRNTNMQTLGAGALARTEMFGRLETRFDAETPRSGLLGDV